MLGYDTVGAFLLLLTAAQALPAAEAPRQRIRPCQPLPPCRVQASQVSGPSFGITQGGCEFRDISARFLTGCKLGCDSHCGPPCGPPNGLHVPETSAAADLHYDLDDTLDNGTFYADQRRAGGADRDSRYGLDTANVIINAGHGAPHPSDPDDDLLQVLGSESASLSKARVGDGEARYLLLASCLVMAHGPETCDPPTLFYGCPQQYEPGAGHRNVFARWLPRIAPGLRLACAGSSLLFPEPFPESFWQHHRVHSRPVADSFLLALSRGGKVPLCMTHGSRVPADTPLFDRRFIGNRNRRAFIPGMGKYLHVMYPVHGSPSAARMGTDLVSALGVSPHVSNVAAAALGGRPSIVQLDELEVPPEYPLLPFGFREVPPEDLLDLGAIAKGLSAQIHPSSGAVIARWSPHPSLDSGRVVGEVLKHPLFKVGSTTIAADSAVSSLVLRIDRIKRAEAEDGKLECFEACRYVLLPRALSVPDPDQPEARLLLPTIGPGSDWVLSSCPRGSGQIGGIQGEDCRPAGRDELMFTFNIRSKGRLVSPEDAGIVVPTGLRPRRDARRRARLELQRLGYDTKGRRDRKMVQRGRPRIAYFAPPVNCAQDYLFPFFRFTYDAAVPRHGTERHSIDIDVPYYPGTDRLMDAMRVCSPE